MKPLHVVGAMKLHNTCIDDHLGEALVLRSDLSGRCSSSEMLGLLQVQLGRTDAAAMAERPALERCRSSLQQAEAQLLLRHA